MIRHSISSIRIVPCVLLTVLFTGLLSGQERPLQRGIDVLHYDFSLTIPATGKIIDGLAVITVRRSALVDRLVLDLVNLHVDSVWVNGHGATFERSPALLTVQLGPPGGRLPDTLNVSVRYGGEPADGLIIHSDAHGRWFAFGDNWPNRARYWLPTVDQPADKATVSWNVTAPSECTVVANGALIDVRQLPPGVNGERKSLTRWMISRPIPTYLMVIGVGALVKYDLGLTDEGFSEFPPGVRQSVYVLPELAEYLPGPFAKAGEIVSIFSRLVGPFPYEKLAHVQSFTRYGGMENASAIFYANDLFEQRSQQAGIIAHETAHQWFGDAVTPVNFAHLWLSEGFASYFEQLWVENTRGVQAFKKGMAGLRAEIARSPVTQSRPVIDTLQTNLMELLNTNSYQKGAWVLHMTRALLGDSLFFGGIRSYYLHHRHSNATSDQLCDEFENISHKDLRWFFDQWLRRPGFPRLDVQWKYDESTHRVILDVTQKQQTGVFRFPLNVKVELPGAGAQTVSVDVPAEHSARIELPASFDSKPLRLLFDPDIDLLASISTN